MHAVFTLFITFIFLLTFSKTGAANSPASGSVTTSTLSKTPELEDVSLLLKWHHQFQFAGIYAAQKEGYFAEVGLKVRIEPRDIRKNNITQVLSGEYTYGISDSVLLLYKLKKQPVVILAAILQRSPQVLVTLKSTDLKNAYQLKDKRIPFYPNRTDGFSITAMLNRLDVKPEYITTNQLDDPEILLKGDYDAYPCYLSNEFYYFAQKGVELNIINPVHYGIDLYGDMIFTSQQEMNDHPHRAERFKRAVLKGWEYALDHPEEMVRYIKLTYQTPQTLEHLRFEAEIIQSFINRSAIPLGMLNPVKMEYIQQLFTDYLNPMNPTQAKASNTDNENDMPPWQHFLKFMIPITFIALLIYFYQLRGPESKKTAITSPSYVPPIENLLSHVSIKKEIDTALQELENKRGPVCLILMELENLTRTGNQFGQAMSDEILEKACHFCQSQMGELDKIGYWDEEHFLLMVHGPTPQKINEMALQLQKGINNLEFSIDYRQMVNMGIACQSEKEYAEALLSKVSTALKSAKKVGSNEFKILYE